MWQSARANLASMIFIFHDVVRRSRTVHAVFTSFASDSANAEAIRRGRRSAWTFGTTDR
jgi:hypothetical protein